MICLTCWLLVLFYASQFLETYLIVSGVPVTLQKVVYKGMVKDDKTLRESGFTSGCKVMVVGSKLDDVLAISTTPPPVFILRIRIDL